MEHARAVREIRLCRASIEPVNCLKTFEIVMTSYNAYRREFDRFFIHHRKTSLE